MKEIEIQEKITKLRESETAQFIKVSGISESLEQIRKRYARENEKLTKIRQEIQRCEGQLYKMAMAEYGVDSYEDLMAFLQNNLRKRTEAMETEERR